MKKRINISAVILVLLLFSAGAVFAGMQGHDYKAEKKGKSHMGKMQCDKKGSMGCCEKGDKRSCKDSKECRTCKKISILLKKSEKLDLSEEQIEKIGTIKIEVKKASIKKQAEIDILKIDKGALFKGDAIDLKALKEILQKIASLEADLQYTCIEAYVNAENVLTDDQKAEFKELKKKFKKSKKSGKEKVLMHKEMHGK